MILISHYQELIVYNYIHSSNLLSYIYSVESHSNTITIKQQFVTFVKSQYYKCQ